MSFGLQTALVVYYAYSMRSFSFQVLCILQGSIFIVLMLNCLKGQCVGMEAVQFP